MTEELKTLTPAEVLLILEPNAGLAKFAKITFFDLVLKGVLKYTKSRKQGDKMVSAGPNLLKYRPRAHESVFLTLFLADKTLNTDLKSFVKSAFQDANSGNEYKFKKIYSERIARLFKTGFLDWFLGTKSLSSTGRWKQKSIAGDLDNVRRKISDSTDLAAPAVLAMRGNIFLIKDLAEPAFKDILKSEKFKQSRSDFNIWFDFDEFPGVFVQDFSAGSSSDFDSTFSEGSGGSGCGSDAAGCSGCGGGGCGGCGGCG